MKLKVTTLLFLILSMTNLNSAAEPYSFYEIGAGGQYLLHSYTGEFGKLPDIPNCCPEFKEGDGSGYSPFIFLGIKLFGDLSLETRVNFSMSNALFVSYEPTTISVNGKPVFGEFEHKLESDFMKVGFQPMLSYEIIKNLNIKAGMDFRNFLSGDYYQIEKITSDIGTFYDLETGEDTKKRERFESEGSIPKLVKMQMGTIAGLSYDLPLNSDNTLWLSPEVYYSFGLTEVVEQTEWKTNTLSAGLSIKYTPKIRVRLPSPPPLPAPFPQLPLPIVPPPPPSIAKEPEKPEVKLISDIRAGGVANGQELEVATMVVEEFLSISMKPLLNYVFFDKNSSDIPDRYSAISKDSSKKFTIGSLNSLSTLSTYYDILNIVGSRLKENPKAKISLVGCNSYNERKRKTLSRKRSKNIKTYLTEVWGISSNRISTNSRNLPKNKSNNSNLDGQAENRRTEIYYDTWEIMKPIVAEDTLRKVSPPVIRFYPLVEADNDVSEWKLTASQDGKVLTVFTGKDSVPQTIDWFIDKEKETIPKFSGNIEYVLAVKDSKGNEAISNKGYLPLDMVTIQKKKETRVGDKRIDRYSLILFDFDSDELGSSNIQIIDFITEKLSPESELVISGFSDRMGATELNAKLSKNRAEQVSKALKRPDSKTIGVGESMLLYDNDLPEGRFYCRTVEIKVETPIKWNK